MRNRSSWTVCSTVRVWRGSDWGGICGFAGAGYVNRAERLRCLGLFRSSMNHPEGEAWLRYSDAARIGGEYAAYMRDPDSYIPGNPGRASAPHPTPSQPPLSPSQHPLP